MKTRGKQMNQPKVWCAIWAQPVALLDNWKADGVNLVIGSEIGDPPTMTQAQYRAECTKRGLFYIMTPKTPADLEAMISDPYCPAIAPFDDEPDLYLPWYTGSPQAVADFQKAVDAKIASAKWIVTQTAKRKRFFVNFCGIKIMNALPWYKGELQNQFVKLLSPNDIICSDSYPRNNNWSGPDSGLTDIVKQTKLFWPGFEYWMFLECSDQALGQGGRGPKAAEMESQLQAVLAAGVTGIAWFSHQFQPPNWNATVLPNSWDGRNPEQRAKVKEINLRLQGGVVVTPPPPPPPSSVSLADFQALASRVSTLELAIKNAVTGVTVTKGI
jgi:hypothetical protein